MNICVKQVARSEWEYEYRKLIETVYGNDRFYIPSAKCISENMTLLMVYKKGRIAACCSTQPQTGNHEIGTIGNFEALNEPNVSKELLLAAVEHLKADEVIRIIGPMNGDTWHRYRFNEGPYNADPFIKEPWNPQYYSGLWECAGFKVCETYDSFLVDDPSKAAANQKKFYDRCMRQNYMFTPITSRNYEEMLPLIYQLSCRIFARNTLYTAISENEFIEMYRPAKALLKDGLSWIAYASDYSPVGYVFTFPDYAEALRAMKGKTGLRAKLRFLVNKRKATRTCLKTLGTIPERRGTGVTAALTYLSYANSARLGYEQTLMCLMHSSNDSRQFGGGSDEPFRKYSLYEYPL